MPVPQGTAFLLACCAMAAIALAADATGPMRKPYKGVFRINTDISAGVRTPEQVIQDAKDCGAKVLFFSDQFICRAEWGLWPLRNLLRVTQSRKSVATYGVRRYLDRLNDLARRNPDLVIVPGLDVAPHYYWTGSPFRGDLTVHQWSEQMTVVPLTGDRPFASMPVVGNPSAPRHWGAASIPLLWPLPVLCLAIALFVRGTVTYTDEQGNTYHIPSSRNRRLSLLPFLVGMVFLLNNFPFDVAPGYSPYVESRPEIYDDFMIWLSSQTAAMAFWSAPEITMRETLSGVQFLTEPYVDHLVATHAATGFAAIYGDARSMCQPGKQWDRILMDYTSGKRPKPLWAVGESDYHGNGPMDAIQTVFLLRDLTQEAVLQDGLANGKMYATCQAREGPHVLLEDFSVSPAAGPQRPCMEPLDFGGGPLAIRATLRVTGKRSEGGQLTVRLVRDGAVLMQKDTALPAGEGDLVCSCQLDETPPSSAKTYYRLLADWPSGEIIANPVFVTYSPRKSNDDDGKR